MENSIATIDSTVGAVTIDIPLRVEILSQRNSTLEFKTSIDELGQIVITPVNKEVEFANVYTDALSEGTPIIEQETLKRVDGETTTTETSFLIRASMLCESDDYQYAACVDDIGQIIIYPVDKKNVFVTASFEQSLNLVTEDLDCVDYFGYKLSNDGDRWNIKTPDGNLLEESASNIKEAKIRVCKEELKNLGVLSEDVETHDNVTNDNTEETTPETTDDDTDTPTPDITSEVVTESKEPSESIDRLDIINRFMMGEIALFSDSGVPLNNYIHISELDDNGYEYYYDQESDIIVSYPEER